MHEHPHEHDHGRADRWIRPRRPREHFPPYELADRDIVARTEQRTRKLARLYHVAQDQAWDGRAVLKELVDKHGGIHFPEDKKEAMGRVAAVLLWGELAAWSISADLALKLEDPAAKMAATSQVFDEARHFYVLRDYLWQAGIPLPRLGGYSRTLLVDLLETDNLLHKLVGMQLMVENAALTLFKAIAQAQLEPVLSELLYYYERDEARHVGLGALALPSILPDLSRLDAGRLWLFQLRIELFMLAGGITMRDAFAALDIDQSAMQVYSFELQRDVFKRMRSDRPDRGDRGHAGATRGLLAVSRAGQDRLNRFLFPQGGEAPRSRWHGQALRAVVSLAERGDRWLAARA
jgi:hypothetical protein